MRKTIQKDLDTCRYEFPIPAVDCIAVVFDMDETDDPGDYWTPPYYELSVNEIKVKEIVLWDGTIQTKGEFFQKAVEWVEQNEDRIWNEEKESLQTEQYED